MDPSFGFNEPFVDAHQHFWDIDANPYPWLQGEEVANFRYGDYAALKRNYLPPDLARDTAGFAPTGTVHIEAEWTRSAPLDETRWLAALSARCGLPSAVVAHAALDRDDAAELLAAQAAFPIVRGIRHKPATAPRPEEALRGAAGSMDDPRWRDGYARLERHALSFDLQAPWWHLVQARDLARDFPNTLLVLNHTGLPSDRSAAGLRGWRTAMQQLATEPNVVVKVSGLGLRDQPWRAEDNAPIIRDTISIFGADRCMFASNFPVDSLVACYSDLLQGFLSAIAHLPQAQRRGLLHDNAVRFYRLQSHIPQAISR